MSNSFPLLLGLYDDIEKGFPQYGCTSLAVTTEAPPTCYSNLVLVGDSQ